MRGWDVCRILDKFKTNWELAAAKVGLVKGLAFAGATLEHVKVFTDGLIIEDVNMCFDDVAHVLE